MKWLILLLTIASCNSALAQQVTKISNEELVELMKKSDLQLVDVRTPAEVAQGFIKGAQNINFFDADFEILMSELDKDKPLAIYCRSGGRSGKAVAKMVTLGFKEIYDVKGGFSTWQSDGFPVVKE